MTESYTVGTSLDDEDASVSESKHEHIQEIEGEDAAINLVKESDDSIYIVEQEYIAIDESYCVESQVDNCYNKENEATNAESSDNEASNEATSSLVNPTKIVDEFDVETSHESIFLDGVNPRYEDDEDDLLEIEVEDLVPKYDDEHLSNEDGMIVLQKRYLIDEFLFGEASLLEEEDQVNGDLIVATRHD